jgi:hypothetical protein
MKLSLIYNPDDTKLIDISYSQSYKDQFLALIDRFDTQHVTTNCSAADLDGDIIIFYDPHSAHHIEIDGIERHHAVKYEYIDDPRQRGIKGIHNRTKKLVHKLGAKDRMNRALQRGVNYIICPYSDSFRNRLGGYIGDMELVWFPVCPDIRRFVTPKLTERKHEVLANGSTDRFPGMDYYDFRRWAHRRREVTCIEHCIKNPLVPRGLEYARFLAKYAGALALCGEHIVPKYVEVPMAGCVCFAQYQEDYKRMGFEDGVNCFYVNKKNFSDTINAFKRDVKHYRHVADAGRKLVEDNWTAEKFADYIYEHAKGANNTTPEQQLAGSSL